MNTNIEVGTRVAFSRKFLQAIGVHSGWRPFARGVVTEINPDFGFAEIAWDKDDTSCVLIANLVREDQLHLEPV